MKPSITGSDARRPRYISYLAEDLAGIAIGIGELFIATPKMLYFLPSLLEFACVVAVLWR
jgi:hypothetical protein